MRLATKDEMEAMGSLLRRVSLMLAALEPRGMDELVCAHCGGPEVEPRIRVPRFQHVDGCKLDGLLRDLGVRR